MGTSPDSSEIKWNMREYERQLPTHTSRSLGEMEEFLENNTLPKATQARADM